MSLTSTTLIQLLQSNPTYPTIKIHLGTTPIDFQPNSSNLSLTTTPTQHPHFTLLCHLPSMKRLGEIVAWGNITDVNVEYWITCTFSALAGYHGRLDKGKFKEQMVIYPVTLKTRYDEVCGFVDGCFSLSETFKNSRQASAEEPMMGCSLDCDNVKCNVFYMCGNQGCKYIICMECFNLYARSKKSAVDDDDDDENENKRVGNLVGLTVCPFCSCGYFCCDDNASANAAFANTANANVNAAIESYDNSDSEYEAYSESAFNAASLASSQPPVAEKKTQNFELYEQMKAMQLASQADAYGNESAYDDPNEIEGFKVTDFTTVGRKKVYEAPAEEQWQSSGKKGKKGFATAPAPAQPQAAAVQGKKEKFGFVANGTSNGGVAKNLPNSTKEERALASVGVDPALAVMFMARYNCRALYDFKGADWWRGEIDREFGYVLKDRDFLVQEYRLKGVKGSEIKWWSPPADMVKPKVPKFKWVNGKQVFSNENTSNGNENGSDAADDDNNDSPSAATAAAKKKKYKLNKLKKEQAKEAQKEKQREFFASLDDGSGTTKIINYDWACEVCGYEGNFKRRSDCFECGSEREWDE